MGPCGGQVLPVRGEGVLGSPASGPQPRGHPELPVPRQSQSRCSPTPTATPLLGISGPGAALLPSRSQGLREPT